MGVENLVSGYKPIDFVVTWVDGEDEAWLEKYNQYSKYDTIDVKNARFRDFKFFKYWFRAVEMYAPWVNHVYLVTDHQVPNWLDESYKKLTIVDHTDIIPEQYLPIFNSNAIEMNLYKISGLSEQFVYFNDDMFINKKVKPSDFFSKDGLPKDTAGLNAIQPKFDFDYIHVNNMKIINEHFDKRKVMKKHFFKFVNPLNMELNIYTLLLFFWPKFTRFFDLHYPYSLKKSFMKHVLETNSGAVSKTMNDRFRDKNDISLWLVRYYGLVQGQFSVRSPRVGKIYDLLDDYTKAKDDISRSKHKMIVLNDNANLTHNQFVQRSLELSSLFNKKMPNKSKFEKGE